MSDKLKGIEVEMTFKVGLSGIEVSSEEHKKLKTLFKSNKEVDSENQSYCEAIEWLNQNINCDDAFEWKYKINNLE